jgi:hypothetical protein
MTYQRLTFLACVFGLILALAACATPSPSPLQEEVFISPDLRFELPPWAKPERSLEAAQVLTGRFGDKSFSFQARLSLNEQRLKVVGIDPLGRRVIDILWDSHGVTATRAAWAPEGLRARNVLADIVIAYWPGEIVESALIGEEPLVSDVVGRRELSSKSGDAVVVSYTTDRLQAWNQLVKLSNVAFDYELTIRSSEIKP